MISIERLGRNALFLAWLQALTNAGLRINLDAYQELKCIEVGDTETFEAMIYDKTDTSDVDVFLSFMNCCGACINTGAAMYEGWDAKIMYEFTGGELVQGIEMKDTNTGARSKAVARVHKADDTCFLWYSNNNGNVHLEYHDIAQKQEMLDALSENIKQAENLNYIEIKQLTE